MNYPQLYVAQDTWWGQEAPRRWDTSFERKVFISYQFLIMIFPIPWLYRHYKGWLYKVIDIVRHTDTGEDLILYSWQGNYPDLGRTDPYFVRSLTEWNKPAQDENGQACERYVLA